MSGFNNWTGSSSQFLSVRVALVYVFVHPSHKVSQIQFPKTGEPINSCTFPKLQNPKLLSSSSFCSGLNKTPFFSPSHLLRLPNKAKKKKKAKIQPLSEIFVTKLPREELHNLSWMTGLVPPCFFLLALLHQCPPFLDFSSSASFTFSSFF